jgi:hypothetical protein
MTNDNMTILHEDYQIKFDVATQVILCSGSLMLNGSTEYEPIFSLLKDAATVDNEVLSLDLGQLEFLNSSGINVFTKFVIHIRNLKSKPLRVIGQQNISWQVRLLKNLQRLMPSLDVQLH